MIKLISSNSTDPYYNLAIEEWAVRNIDTSNCSYLFLYQNTNSVVIGRNQNVFQEVNIKYCKKNNIQICRRVSGGGTVFHDLGNLNWTFISKFNLSKVNNYKYFSATIIKCLLDLKLDVSLNKRNAIMVGQYKISGQAQFTNRNNILSHGTLLFNSDIVKLNSSTLLSDISVSTRASKSVRSDVMTINQLLKNDVSIVSFKKNLQIENNITEEYTFSKKDIDIILNLESKYKTTQWIFNRSSKCIIQKTINREVLFLEIEDTLIKGIKNKKGEELNQHPFIGLSFLDLS